MINYTNTAIGQKQLSGCYPKGFTTVADAVFYRSVNTAADVGLVVQAMNGIILWANDAYTRMMMRPLDKIIGFNPLSFALPPEHTPSDADIAAFRHHSQPRGTPQVYIYENQRGNGDRFWVELNISFDHISDFGEVAIVATRDISDHIMRQRELQATSAKLSHLAATDSLTGLANRLNVMGKMSQALSRTYPDGRGVGIIEIDLDHFKAINDSFGHSAGDDILSKLGDVLRQVISNDDVAARIGGDEFLVLFPNAQSLDDIAATGRIILEKCQKALHVNGTTIHCGLSIGAAFSNERGLSPENFLKRADFALYEAKTAGRGRVATYDKTLHTRQVELARLGDELCDAVENETLSYHFQPTLDLGTGEINGFETLVRWNNPRLGAMSPADFLPLAKSLGLMVAIDLGALRAALDLKLRLIKKGYPAVTVGLNGSTELLGHPEFYDRLMAELDQRGLCPRDILIEVLETVVFEDISPSNPLVQTVQRLHDAGVATLLDDFGTGHAGLTHLATLAVKGVKIDRTLTRNILTDPTCAKIISMMFELCRDLDIRVVTEGIETPEQLQAIVSMGGTIIQGYWLARAMPASDVLAWLDDRKKNVPLCARSAIADGVSPRY